MADPFLGEIKMFAGNYAIRNYALCAGQTLSISQYESLFSLLQTMYGGNGTSTFCLPDLRGRTAIHAGDSAMFGTHYPQGIKGGHETVPLTADHVPNHTHTLHASAVDATTNEPQGKSLAKAGFYCQPPGTLNMNAGSIGASGQGHYNWQPSLAINYIIALIGTYPPRH